MRVAGIIMIIIGSCSFAKAQLSEKETGPVIEKTAQLIKEHYVFEEKGAKIAAHLVSKYKEGAFRNATSPKIFDSLVTKILRDYSQDGHLFFRYDPETASAQKTAEAGDGEDLYFYGPKASENNFGFREVKVLDGNIGYIKLSEINISEKSLPILYASMRFVANTKALIIDLQNNGGGGSNIGSVFESYFLPKNTTLLEFKSRTGKTEIDKTVPWLTEEKYNKPVYILVNGGTASAAEAFAYVLQANKKATIVGQVSAGAANMNTFYPVNGLYFVSVSTAAPTLPGTQNSWEHKGIQPDHVTTPGEEIKFIKERGK